jgi:creatinine amidohydrolase
VGLSWDEFQVHTAVPENEAGICGFLKETPMALQFTDGSFKALNCYEEKIMNKSFVLEMTWEEFRDSINSDTVFLLPIGSTELEGLHLPLGVDTIVAEGVCKNLAGERGVLIGPTLPVGYSKWFNPFPGTISLEQDTLNRVLREYCGCLIKQGIKRLVFLNAHRGNNNSIEIVAHSLILKHHVKIGMLNIWKLANDLTAGSGLIKEGRFTHAGEIMTSVILALKPETVIASKIMPDTVKSPKGSAFEVKNSLGETTFKGSVQTVYQDIRDVTDTGIMGDPTAASAEKGEAILKLITDYTRAFLREFRNLPIERETR